MHYSKTLTEHDIKHIERHLSMKRTIRKKIMRDLQQAFVQVVLLVKYLNFFSQIDILRIPQSLARIVWGGAKGKSTCR